MPLSRRILVSLVNALGWALRVSRVRGRHIPAAALHRAVPDLEVSYRDRWGYVRKAWFGDEMQALGFVGKPALPRELNGIVGPGDWVIDVGANIGITTAELCALVGELGTVWAIEPFPPNLSRLRELKEANDLRRLQIVAGALSDHREQARLRVPIDGSSGHASLVDATESGRVIDIEAWPLDDLVQRRNPTGRLSFVKIDVEGHELRVLEGALGTLQRHHPAVLCEFNDAALAKAGSLWLSLLGRFEELGYEPVAVYKEGRYLRRVNDRGGVERALSTGGGVVDVLLVRGSSEAASIEDPSVRRH